MIAENDRAVVGNLKSQEDRREIQIRAVRRRVCVWAMSFGKQKQNISVEIVEKFGFGKR